MPVFRTNRMPVRTLRWSLGLRPGKRKRRGGSGGNNGSMRTQSASVTSGFIAVLQMVEDQIWSTDQLLACQLLINSERSKEVINAPNGTSSPHVRNPAAYHCRVGPSH